MAVSSVAFILMLILDLLNGIVPAIMGASMFSLLFVAMMKNIACIKITNFFVMVVFAIALVIAFAIMFLLRRELMKEDYGR